MYNYLTLDFLGERKTPTKRSKRTALNATFPHIAFKPEHVDSAP